MVTLEEKSVVPSTGSINVSAGNLTVPAEIVYLIMQFLDPLELLRLQTTRISKQFHSIVNDPALWRMVYWNARFARPPGPFPWQSTRFLRRTLVRSAQLAQTWTSQPFKALLTSFYQEMTPSINRADYRWASERWLVVRQSAKKIISHDIDTGSDQTLWDSGPISSWELRSSIASQGHMIYLILRVGNGDNHDIVNLKLLEFRADEDSGHLSGPVIFDVPENYLTGQANRGLRVSPRGNDMNRNTPFLSISVDPHYSFQEIDLVFDIRSRRLYKFPPFQSQVDEVQSFSASWSRSSDMILLTRTHVFVLSPLALGDHTAGYLIQAFVAPAQPSTDSSATQNLFLTHEGFREGIFHSFHNPPTLIYNSALDPATGSTMLKFMHVEFDRQTSSFHFYCTELSLPHQQTGVVLPMSLEVYEILVIQGVDSSGDDLDSISVSDDGYVRGYCLGIVFGGSLADQAVICRYSIDASGKRCVAVASDILPLGADVRFLWYSNVGWFDGLRGRACYTDGMETPTRRISFIKVVDLE